MKLTYCHHIGTLAFGSLLLAIVDMLRVIVEYVDKKKKDYEDADPPCLWTFVFCCLRCCLCCLDKCLRFFNKQAYIQTVINGKDLCTGACRAGIIMVRHLDLFAALLGVQGAVFWFGRLAISVGTTAICGLWISQLDVSSITLPCLVCLFIGYVISNTVMCVYELGIDTMVMCWCEVKAGDQKEPIPPDCIPSALTGQMEVAEKQRQENDVELENWKQNRRNTKAQKMRESADQVQAGPAQGGNSKATV
jgi:hypothetical protein